MHSPMKSNAKKTRKSTFNQATVSQSDVGDFSGGYFIMADPTSASTKENDYPLKSNKNSQHKLSDQRSPSKRKSTPGGPNDYTAPPSPTCKKVDNYQDLKKPHTIAIEINKDFNKRENSKVDLLIPGSVAVPSSYYCPDSPSKCKDYLSTSPFASGRWAGPAFGNAPHPSTLPLPEWFPSTHATSQTTNDVTPQTHKMSPLDAFISSSPPRTSSSIPAVPFPYVASHVPLPTPNSLAQLSTDLRRLLNINEAVPEAIEVVLVSASSS